MTKEEIEFSKLSVDCKKEAISNINTCYHPDCNEKSINSHILQENGILSQISPDRHLWQLVIDEFSENKFKFKRTGIRNIFSFKCFCNQHDENLFKKIEKGQIDFKDYESQLLFTLRTIYNEIWRKEVNLKVNNCLIQKKPEIFNVPFFIEQNENEKLGLADLKNIETDIWNDLINGTQNFVFEERKLSKIEICLSAFYNYDSLEEMYNYKLKYGRPIERVSMIFINLFPNNDNSILLMGYNKKDEKKVKGYFYTFFKESTKRVERKITSLILFHCENWVASNEFYKSKIKGIEKLYVDGLNYSFKNPNERKTYDLNIFKSNFKEKYSIWNKKYVG